MKQPKGLIYKAEYEPDMSRMVRALRVLLEYPKGGESSERTSPPCKSKHGLVMVASGTEHSESCRIRCPGVADSPAVW